jgi:hypothetical protein
MTALFVTRGLVSGSIVVRTLHIARWVVDKQVLGVGESLRRPNLSKHHITVDLPTDCSEY